MSYINQQPKHFIKSLQIIHVAIMASVFIFGAYVVLNAKEALFFSYEDNKPFLFLAIIIAFAGNMASKLLYKKMIAKILISADLNEKTLKYSTAHIYRMAMLEFPAFMCVFFAMETNNSFYFVLVGILVFMMLAIFPTKSKFENDVPLTSNEKSILEKL